MRSIFLLLALATSPWVQAQQVAYNPTTGSEENPAPVMSGKIIRILNNTGQQLFIAPMSKPTGPLPAKPEPIAPPIVIPGLVGVFPVPNIPDVLGLPFPFALDPSTLRDPLFGL